MWSWLCGSNEAREVILYTRQGCHLCDDALAVLRDAARSHPLALRQVDIDTDPTLVAEYGLCVPVVLIDGKVRFRGIVNPVLLHRILRAAPQRENAPAP